MHTTPSKPVNPESLHAGYEVSDARPSLIIIAMVAIGLMGAAGSGTSATFVMSAFPSTCGPAR